MCVLFARSARERRPQSAFSHDTTRTSRWSIQTPEPRRSSVLGATPRSPRRFIAGCRYWWTIRRDRDKGVASAIHDDVPHDQRQRAVLDTERLEKHGAYPVELGRWKRGRRNGCRSMKVRWCRHSIIAQRMWSVNLENMHRPANRKRKRRRARRRRSFCNSSILGRIGGSRRSSASTWAVIGFKDYSSDERARG